MDENYAQQILKETQANYNRNAEDFSRARQEVWSETEFLVEDYLTSGDKVLDLGCGNGRYFELMKDKEINYFGVDNSEQLIEIAQERYSDYLDISPPSDRPQAEFQVGDCLNLSFPSNYFTIAYSFAVLHHIPSQRLREKFVKEVQRVLKPDSFFIVAAWNVWNDSDKKKKIVKNNLLRKVGLSKLGSNDIKTSYGGLDQVYLHCFKKEELVDLIEKAGFEVKRTGFIDWKNKEKANLFVVARNKHV